MTTQMKGTVNVSISPADREELANSLGVFLAETYTLYLKTQNYHWNVRGPKFSELHKLFEAQYQELAQAVDLIAERIRALGFLAPATFSEFLKKASIQEGDETLAATDMIKDLEESHEQIAQIARGIFPKAEKAHDQASVDLFARRMAEHEKAAWMLRSLLED